jgi:hypothetical protein
LATFGGLDDLVDRNSVNRSGAEQASTSNDQRRTRALCSLALRR